MDEKKEKNKPETAVKKELFEKAELFDRDLKVIAAINKSVRGAEFKRIYSGKAEKDERNEKRFMAILNFFTASDAEQMQRIYYSSKIYDAEKGKAYAADLIGGAIKQGEDFSKQMKTQLKNRQKCASSAKGAAR